MKKYLAFIILLMFLTITILPYNVNASWWDTDWNYYKTCNISNPIDDYQMKLIVGKSVGGNVTCDNHCQDDFDDIRFVALDNLTEYPYWIENYTLNTQATFWIKNIDNASNILMYYGNSGVSNTSNGDNTFCFFDNFNSGTNPDSNKWDTIGTINIDSGYCKLNPSETEKIFSKSDYWYGENHSLRFRANLLNDGGGLDQRALGWMDTSRSWEVYQIFSPRTNYDSYKNGTSYQAHNTHTFTSGFKNYEIKRMGIKTHIRFYENNDMTTEITDTNYITNSNLMPYFYVYVDDTDRFWLDWVLVREYKSNKPYWGNFGNETTNISNNAPTQSNQLIWDISTNTEKNLNATDVKLNPTCFNVTIADLDSDYMNVTIKTNESGNWKTVNETSSGMKNGTYNGYNTSWIDKYSTKYWISFNVSDNLDWCNETFNFTTIAWTNTCPSSSSENPSNNSVGVSINIGYWNITITDIDGNITSGNITCSNGEWDSWNNQTNGIKSCNLSLLNYSTTYTIWVNFTDEHCSVNETYSFITISSTPSTTIKLDDNQFSILLLLALFLIFMSIGYSHTDRNENENSFYKGFFIFISGLIFLSMSLILSNNYNIGYISHYMNIVSIIIMLIGILKGYYGFR